MNADALCKKYQAALSTKNLLAIQNLFTPDAIVKAPISGTANVEQFHAYLFSNTNRTIARFPNVLSSRDDPPSITMQFSYTLSIANGDVAVLDGIALFDIEPHSGKFKSLTITYDATELRRFMQEAGIVPPPASA
jgi:hypothetical protein